MFLSRVERKVALESVETMASTLPVLQAAISKPPAPEKSETMRTLRGAGCSVELASKALLSLLVVAAEIVMFGEAHGFPYVGLLY